MELGLGYWMETFIEAVEEGNFLPWLTQIETYYTTTRQLYLAKDEEKTRMAYFVVLQCYFEKMLDNQ